MQVVGEVPVDIGVSSTMDLTVSYYLFSVVVILGFILLSVKSALAPMVPIRGKTNLPGPPGLPAFPILGHGWKFFGVTNPKDLNAIVESIIARFHRAASFWIGSKLFIATGDAELNEYIVKSSKFNKKDLEAYGPINKFMDGVFSRNGEGWSDLRKPLNKFLQPKTVVEKHFDVIVARSEEICKKLDGLCNNGIFDIHPHLQNLSLEITCEALMGVPAALVKHLRFDLHWANSVTKIWFQLVSQVHYRFRWVFYFSKIRKEMELLQDHIVQFGKRLINYRRRILTENDQNPEDPDFKPECYTDVTIKQALKENHDGFTMPTDLVIAGYDTSSVSLSSTCLFLAMHPESQERAYQEQIAIMGDSLRAPSYEETTKMDYLGMVYLETLRHVGVPAIVRQLSAEAVVDDIVFPEGAAVYMTLHGTNMRIEYWEKPREFYPDHFLPENVSKRPKGAFLPFSAGARVCPGKAFALISSKIILSMLLRRFHFATTLKFNEMEYSYFIMLESANGYPVQLTRRTPNKNDLDSVRRRMVQNATLHITHTM